MTTPRLIFFGTSDFAQAPLEALIKADYDVIAVVTTPDAPVGRKHELTPSPIKRLALQYNLSLLQPATLRDNQVREQLAELKPDVAIVVAYGKILPLDILTLPTHGTLNIHPSLLPLYRGPSPIQGALLHNDQQTGVSLMQIDEAMDHGPIVAQEPLAIKPDETYIELAPRLASLGAELLIKSLPDYLNGTLQPQAQDDSHATYTSLIKTSDGQITATDSVSQAYGKIRALNPNPGSFIDISVSPLTHLRILSARIAQDNPQTRAPLSIFTRDHELFLQLKDGALRLIAVQATGGKPMSGHDFINGHKELLTPNDLEK